MQKNKNRTGLALGAIVALVSSLLVITAPSQASETSVVAFPASGLETQTTVLITEGFDLGLRFGTGVSADRATAGFGVVVTKPANLDIVASESALTTGRVTASPSSSAAFTFGVVSTSGVALSLPLGTALSESVTITATPFIDLNKNGVKDAGETSGNPVSITFVPLSALGATVAVGQPLTGEDDVTVSFALAAGTGFNYSMLDNDFKVRVTVSSTSDVAVTSVPFSGSQLANAAASFSINNGAGVGKVQALSGSFAVAGAVLTGGISTVSAMLLYNDLPLKSTGIVTAAMPGVADVVISFSAKAENIAYSTSVHADARFNSAFTLDAYPWTVSSTQSAAVASAFTVSAVGAGMNFGAEAGVIVNGTTYTSSASLLGAGFTLASGTKTVAVSTFGQLDSGTNETVTFKLSAQLQDASMTVTFRPTVQTVVYTPLTVSGLAGVAKAFALTAKDQWGVSSVRMDQRIAGSVVLGGSTSPTAYGAVVNGAATVVVTPTPAIRTGSAVVTFTLQTFDQGTQAYKDTGVADTAAWNVFSYVAGTDSITSRTVSISSSISYGVALSWSPTAVAVVVANSFSEVVASAPGLMIQNADSVTVTASDVLTIAANGKTANFKFTSRLAGTYTVTFTNGTATTTSTIIVDVAGHDSGATLTFDKASIAAGTTTTVTGTLKDVNGNPVMTSGSSNVSVAWSGKGLPFGNATDMKTDAAGQLTFYVLVLSGEVGDAAISATYKPAGLAVSTKNVTVVHAVAVGKAAATSADQKITIGTYKGYVGVFTKGYEGQKLSVRLASKWHVRNPIEDLKAGYSLLTVNTGVGYVANVIVYIDGVEVERMTITTK
jgi:hypothetical protein